MDAVNRRIKQIYYEYRNKPAFQRQFNNEIATFIKAIVADGSIHEDKLMYELKFIAERSKKRSLAAKQYLRLIARLASDATKGHHSQMEFDTEKLELKNNL